MTVDGTGSERVEATAIWVRAAKRIGLVKVEVERLLLIDPGWWGCCVFGSGHVVLISTTLFCSQRQLQANTVLITTLFCSQISDRYSCCMLLVNLFTRSSSPSIHPYIYRHASFVIKTWGFRVYQLSRVDLLPVMVNHSVSFSTVK